MSTGESVGPLTEIGVEHRASVLKDKKRRVATRSERILEGDMLNGLQPRLNNSNETERSERIPDGDFNGLPLYYLPSSKLTTSKAHCVGENFHDDAWQYRSCELKHFCYDFNTTEFFVVATEDPNEVLNEQVNSNRNHTFSAILSTSLDVVDVSIKVMTSVLSKRNTDSTQKQKQKQKQFDAWKPVVRPPPVDGYYELPSDIVWIPIHTQSEYTINPGHVLWDYLLPIHTLLSMFGHDNKLTPLVTDLNWRCGKKGNVACFYMMSKLMPLLGVSPRTLSKQAKLVLHVAQNTNRRSNIMCAKRALVGIGMLSDHGRNKHGQVHSDYTNMRNMGRGPDLYRFRNFMLHNMGIDIVDEMIINKPPYQILVSQKSSTRVDRQRSFDMQVAALRHSFSSEDFMVRPLVLADLTLEQQLRVLAQSKVYIGVMGGGAAFASFLPRGSTVVLYYDDIHDFVTAFGGVEVASRHRRNITDQSSTEQYPVMMDWDFFNNAAYLKVHWFPLSTMDTEEDLGLLIRTIRDD